MRRKPFSAALTVLAAVAAVAHSGCIGITEGPNLGFLAVPIPVSPYFQDKKEVDHWTHERYARAPILGPLTAGGPTAAIDPPSDDEVMLALERAAPVSGGLPMLHEVQRNNVTIVKEKIADYIDPPRVYPLLGPAQLHHAHYKCTIYYSEKVRVGWPVPHTLVDQDEVEVIYVDHNHLHMVGNVDTGPGTHY